MAYTAFVLSEKARAQLLAAFPPENPDVICHHVTQNFGVPVDTIPPVPARVVVIGYAFDDCLECFVVEVNGVRHRADGKLYHITHSLNRAKGRKPVESNDVLAAYGYKAIDRIDLGLLEGATL